MDHVKCIKCGAHFYGTSCPTCGAERPIGMMQSAHQTTPSKTGFPVFFAVAVVFAIVVWVYLSRKGAP